MQFLRMKYTHPYPVIVPFYSITFLTNRPFTVSSSVIWTVWCCVFTCLLDPANIRLYHLVIWADVFLLDDLRRLTSVVDLLVQHLRLQYIMHPRTFHQHAVLHWLQTKMKRKQTTEKANTKLLRQIGCFIVKYWKMHL